MRIGIVLLWLALLAGGASTLPELSGRLAAEGPAGCAEYRFLLFRLYRAELWTDAAVLPGENFALSLTYRRAFSKDELVSSSISEMARMSGRPETSFARANAEIEGIMRAVAVGDRFTTWRSGPARVEFFFNGESVGALTHDADLFLDIWLGPETRAPDPRDRLLAGDCGG